MSSTTRNRHGFYTIDTQDHLIVTACTGSWNEETVVDYAEDILKHAANMSHQNWALVSTITEWGLTTPDALKTWNKYSITMQDSGLIALALVSDQNMLTKSVIVKNNVAPDHPEFAPEFFPDVDSAILWSKERLSGLK